MGTCPSCGFTLERCIDLEICGPTGTKHQLKFVHFTWLHGPADRPDPRVGLQSLSAARGHRFKLRQAEEFTRQASQIGLGRVAEAADRIQHRERA